MGEGPSTCQPVLWAAVERWKAGQLSGAELVEASYVAQLDLLADYERKPLPSVPQEVAEYRALGRGEQEAFSQAAARRLLDRHAAFFAQERTTRLRNAKGQAELAELLAWATAKGLPKSVLAQVQAALGTHEDMVDVG